MAHVAEDFAQIGNMAQSCPQGNKSIKIDAGSEVKVQYAVKVGRQVFLTHMLQH